jgi:hypothetical protein
VQHFSVVTDGATGITGFSLEPLDPAQEQIRILPCTSLSTPVTMSVRVNTATDGSDSGRWDVIGEQAGACATPDTAPVWNTLPYTDGVHLVRLVATSPASTVMSDIPATLGPRRPLTPTLLAPVPLSGSFSDPVYLNSHTLAFSWLPSTRADSYTLLVSTRANPQSDPNPLVSQILPAGTTHATVALTADYPSLYWQLVAVNSMGPTASGAQLLNMDLVRPQCTVQFNPATSQVSWSATDAGSGISSVNLRFTDISQSVPYSWMLNLPAAVTSAPFTGQVGHSYSFLCEAFDVAGNDSLIPSYLPLMMR